jgi:hypothetical protein
MDSEPSVVHPVASHYTNYTIGMHSIYTHALFLPNLEEHISYFLKTANLGYKR